MESTSHRLFVSHSHLDNEFGMKLAQDLSYALTEEDAVFYDVLGGLHGGDSWWHKIVELVEGRDNKRRRDEAFNAAYITVQGTSLTAL